MRGRGGGFCERLGETYAKHQRTSLPSGSRTQQRSGPYSASHRAADHRSPRPRIRPARAGASGGSEADFQDQRQGHDFSVVRHRRVGSGHRQHAFTRRQGSDVRDRPVRDVVERDGGQSGTGRAFCRERLASRRRARRGGIDSPRGSRPPDQGRDGGAQRNLQRGDQLGSVDAQSAWIAPSIPRF